MVGKSVSKAELDELLSDDSAPNEPLPIAAGGDGAGGRKPRVHVPEREMRQRREAVANLLVSGYSRDRILEVMTQATVRDEKGKERPGFGLTEREVDRLISNVRAEWDEETTELKRYAKDAAVRRILRHINEARNTKAYGAIANLEKVLMLIQGTAEPLEVQVPVDSRVTDALLRILGEKDPLLVREMIERERAIEVESRGTDVPMLSADFPKKGDRS
jgi:hypothetical protein